MRTFSEIQASIKEDFIANETLQNAYGFVSTANFDNLFSTISIEAVLIYIVASAIYAHEVIFSQFQTDVTADLGAQKVPSEAWYQAQALAFQDGVVLTFDSATYSYKYATVDTSKQIVKFAAIRTVQDAGITKLKIMVSGAAKAALTAEQLARFSTYITQQGVAGMHYLISSTAPDPIAFSITVYYDPLVLDNEGKRIDDATDVITAAINAYLDSVAYGGQFYVSKLMDKLQSVEGVEDISIASTTWNGSTANQRFIEALSGAFAYDSENSNITFSAQ